MVFDLPPTAKSGPIGALSLGNGFIEELRNPPFLSQSRFWSSVKMSSFLRRRPKYNRRYIRLRKIHASTHRPNAAWV